jgi:5-methylcytosine-specific restriction endonuclease McrA
MARASAGRSSRRWLQVLVPNVKAQAQAGRPCHFCHQPVDVTLPSSHDAAFHVHHIRNWVDYPELREEPTNLAPSHRVCNQSNGERRPTGLPTDRPSLGEPSREW